MHYDQSKHKPLLTVDGRIQFVMEDLKLDEYTYTFKVYEVVSWNSGEQGDDPSEIEEYIYDGIIKWDGCSHINFGESDNQGYLHLCGAHYWKQHNLMMEALYKLASEVIAEFDKEGESWKN